MSWIALQGRALCAASSVGKAHLKKKKHENFLVARGGFPPPPLFQTVEQKKK